MSQDAPRTKSVVWAPWRLEYVLSEKEPDCIFCEKPEQDEDESNLILVRGPRAFAMLNLFPYNNGHLMVVPYRHVDALTHLDPAELTEVMLITQACERVFARQMSPDGMNIGLNLGSAAGAGIDEHLHLHLVPRWHGDTNFMPVLAETNVIPQSLRDNYHQLRGPLTDEVSRLLRSSASSADTVEE